MPLDGLLGSIQGIFYIPPYIVVLGDGGGGCLIKLKEISRKFFNKKYKPQLEALPDNIPPINPIIRPLIDLHKYKYQLLYVSKEGDLIGLSIYGTPEAHKLWENNNVKDIGSKKNKLTFAVDKGNGKEEFYALEYDGKLSKINELGNTAYLPDEVNVRSIAIPNKIFSISKSYIETNITGKMEEWK